MAEEIWHHGIKGMKWGVRHTPEQLGRVGGLKKWKESPHEDYTKAHDRKGVKTMSDAELRARLNRLDMERRYSQMNPNSVERGRAMLKSTLAVVGTVATVTTAVITVKRNYETIRDWIPNPDTAADISRKVRNLVRNAK